LPIDRLRRRQAFYSDGLHGLFQRTALNPDAARLRTEFDPPVRVLAYKAPIVIYETKMMA